ncbi:PAS domain S-box-containing protein/diguanylate cyclase (GGDEF) domain-containing protein [Sphingomonas carotinifaciens]|uniref:PAS domain S-box-containing protein/diguanylate cyclase (GGDEF) domain-containing protein n=1 Tax=Sphingomonas carotinifaciens TaxID=1166323 RepID=A0A1G7F6M2_9SPHN|nr:PAS domain S-box-containing protein/diguanylate cyclase (GGDEF) domain-containing protein [Sphingomonas carotinifaciens]
MGRLDRGGFGKVTGLPPAALGPDRRSPLLHELGGPWDASAGPPLSEVLSRARIGILHRDVDLRVLAVNGCFCDLIGRSADALDGVSMEAFTHPDDVARSSALYRAQRERAEPFRIEKRYRRPDGSVVWCAVHVSFLCDADGHVASTITVAQDITAQRIAEQELRESEAHYRHTVELNPQIGWTAGPDGAIQAASPRWCDVTASEPGDALGHGWLDAVHPDDVGRAVAAWHAAIASAQPVDVEYRLRTPAGYRWFRSRAAARLDDLGRVVRWYGTLEDIDDRTLAQEALRASEERFRLAAQAAGLGIWDYDAVRDRREWSPEFKAMLGLSPDAAPEVATALALVVPEDRHLLSALVEAVRAGDSAYRFDVTLRIRRADTGEERWMRTDGWRIQAPSGTLARVLVTVRDVTEERTAEDRIRWTANHDALTGLPNRAHFTMHLDAAIERARASGRRLALALFDVDHLKETNDTIGHDAGDRLLSTFAARLARALGDDAVLGRLGGDEFAAFIPLAPDQDVDTVGDTVRAALRALHEPFAHDNHILDCQATAGASLYPRDGGDTADLLKAADIALYAGKARHRGTLSLFRPEMRAHLQRRASMLGIARAAVRDARILPFYQPKVSLHDGRITGFEALLRWHHGHHGIQAPETIAAAFEDFDLAPALGERMLDGVIADIRQWLAAGLDPGRIAVNLSPAEFRHDNLVQRIMDRLHHAGIPPERLELEVTETVFLGRGAEAVGTMLEAFHAGGIRIALDDFGTGYASLTHLKDFPVDVIKIDRSFVGNLCAGSGDAAIVDAIVGLGRRLGMEVVAEGVETQAQADYLRAQHCPSAQGFLFGMPMTAAAVADRLTPAAPPRE